MSDAAAPAKDKVAEAPASKDTPAPVEASQKVTDNQKSESTGNGLWQQGTEARVETAHMADINWGATATISNPKPLFEAAQKLDGLGAPPASSDGRLAAAGVGDTRG